MFCLLVTINRAMSRFFGFRKDPLMVSSKQTTIINATGLHARPASVFASEAKKFESNVTIKHR